MRGKGLGANLRVILTTFELHLKQQAVDLFVIFTVLVQPILIALLAIYVLRNEAATNAIYIVVGSGMTGLWSGLLFTSAFNIRGERWMGTLEMLVGSPTPLYVIVIGKTLANVLLSLGSMILGYFVAALLFRLPLIVIQPLQCLGVPGLYSGRVPLPHPHAAPLDEPHQLRLGSLLGGSGPPWDEFWRSLFGGNPFRLVDVGYLQRHLHSPLG